MFRPFYQFMSKNTFNASGSRIFGLDLLRAVAILSVLVCHILVALKNSVNLSHSPLLFKFKVFEAAGPFGVEIFFVLSGFLIGQIIVKLFNSGLTFEKVKTFWVRRWFRTLPLYYSLLLLKLLTSRGEAFPLSTLVFLHPFNAKSLEYFGITWSLAVEEWFYLFLPVICLLFSKIFNKKSLLTLLIVGIAFFAASEFNLYYLVNPEASFQELFRIGLPLKFDALLMGVVLAYFKINSPDKFKQLCSGSVSFAGLALVVLSYLYWVLSYQTMALYSTISLVFAGGVALLLPWTATSKPINVQLPKLPVLSHFISYTSQISYSLYLTHVIFMTKIHYYPNNVIFTLANVFAVLVVVYLVASVCYYFIELPGLGLRDKLSPSSSKNQGLQTV
jgi:peptidoglycan/LPS O-acetylase OafA/YrhL